MSTNLLPNGLDLVIDFVNTLDCEQETDAISDPEALRTWLAERKLLDDHARVQPPTDDDHAEAIRLREALRALMLANNGGEDAPAAWMRLEEAARRGELAVHFERGGEATIRPDVAGVPGALARLLVPVAAAITDNSWARVKACRSPDCLWAFYDRSRNHSGRWCEMAVCGNRTKVRAYRDRSAARAR